MLHGRDPTSTVSLDINDAKSMSDAVRVGIVILGDGHEATGCQVRVSTVASACVYVQLRDERPGLIGMSRSDPVCPECVRMEVALWGSVWRASCES